MIHSLGIMMNKLCMRDAVYGQHKKHYQHEKTDATCNIYIYLYNTRISQYHEVSKYAEVNNN